VVAEHVQEVDLAGRDQDVGLGDHLVDDLADDLVRHGRLAVLERVAAHALGDQVAGRAAVHLVRAGPALELEVERTRAAAVCEVPQEGLREA
jgi:hypothetical protein